MAQQRLEHILRVRKINPDLGRGFWGGGPMGPGMMHCGMMGPCGSSHRGPENCLHGTPGGGYGRKPQMMRHRSGYGMGPGMMHRGGCGMGPGYGRGSGMMGSGRPDRDDDRQYYKGQGSQPE